MPLTWRPVFGQPARRRWLDAVAGPLGTAWRGTVAASIASPPRLLGTEGEAQRWGRCCTMESSCPRPPLLLRGTISTTRPLRHRPPARGRGAQHTERMRRFCCRRHHSSAILSSASLRGFAPPVTDL